eukprot:m.370534 g.370534  ORF g.370534 m.370534 type:complete len:58 (+) comp56130_c0_seq3:3740-3913(+)
MQWRSPLPFVQTAAQGKFHAKSLPSSLRWKLSVQFPSFSGVSQKRKPAQALLFVHFW